MTKDEFVTERTRIISEMLDNPDKHGIYPTTKCFNELDALFDKLTSDNSDYTKSCDDCIYGVDGCQHEPPCTTGTGKPYYITGRCIT